MPMDIEIKVDPKDSLTKAQQVEDALGKVEAKGPKVGESVGEGMKKAGEAAKEAAGAANRFGVELEGSITSSALGKFGELGTLFDKLTSKGVLEAGALVGVGLEVANLNDEYVKLQNNAMRLAPTYETVNETISQQLELAGQLHGSLEQTMELSTIVKERFGEIGMSMKEQTEFTKDLGEAVELSGHSMGDAANVINRLSFALESGLPAGREMKNIMREFPALAEALQSGLHKTNKEIIELAQHGKLGMDDFANAVRASGEELDVAFGHRHTSAWDDVKHGVEEAKVAIGESIDTIRDGVGDAKDFIHDKLGAVGSLLTGDLSGAFKSTADHTLALSEAWDRWNKSIGVSTDALKLVRNEARELLVTRWGLNLEQMDAIDHQAATFKTMADNIGKLPQALDLASKGLEKFVGVLEKQGIRGLVDPWAPAIEAVHHHTHALTEEQKILEKINGPMEEETKGIATIGKLYGEAKITLEQYNDELERLYALNKLKPSSVTGGALQTSTPGIGTAAAYSDVPTPPSAQDVAYKNYEFEMQAKQKQWNDKDLTAKWKQDLADYEKQAQKTYETLGHAFTPVVTGIESMFKTGKLNLAQIGDAMETQLEDMAIKFVMFEALTGMGANPAFLKGLGVGGFANGGDAMIPHAANGYTGKVGGYGGTDSKLAMLWVTPGEQVSVRTPEQQAAAARGTGGQAPGVTIINKHDTRGELAAAVSSGSMDTHFINLMRRNAGAIQALIRK